MARRARTSLSVVAFALAGSLVAAAPAEADPMPDYFARGVDGRAAPVERSHRAWAIVGGLAGAALIVGGVGLAFHLDSRSAANQLGASLPTGEPWDAAHQAVADRAVSSGHKAEALYALGGASMIGAFVVFVLSEHHGADGAVIAGGPARGPLIVPTAGGAVVGGGWSF
jgi:hypothetical protein